MILALNFVKARRQYVHVLAVMTVQGQDKIITTGNLSSTGTMSLRFHHYLHSKNLPTENSTCIVK